MRGHELKRLIQVNLPEQSGLDPHRPYLGMSSISQCPHLLYKRFHNGTPQSDKAHWFCKMGYTFEDVIAGLIGLGRIQDRGLEVVASFDARFRGHIDGTIDGNLLEIKSVEFDKFQAIVERRVAEQAHFDQVQMYLRHGGYNLCHLVYVARDVPSGSWYGLPVWVFDIHPQSDVQSRLNLKAQRILAAIDAGVVPECECGKCL